MKKIFALLFGALFVFPLSSSVFAQSDRWIINRDGDSVEMRKQYDYDPANRYRGNIDNSGDIRLRNYDGDRLKGNIDSDGYGKLHDDYGNTYRVRPR